jgi:CHAT domain-containing protein/Tfp pilus assembly protein PilF
MCVRRSRLLAGIVCLALTGAASVAHGRADDLAQYRAGSQKGLALYGADRLADALPHLEKAAGLAEKLVGPDHLTTGQCLNNLALLYWKLGRYGKAEPLFQRSLRIIEDREGKNHPDVAALLNNLGMLYQAQGQYDQAEPLYQRSLKIMEAARPGDHPDVATSLNNLAHLYWDMGRYDQAESLYQRSLQIREAVRPRDQAAVAQSLNNLAVLYQSLGDYDKAESLLRRGLRLLQTSPAVKQTDVAAGLNNLGRLYWDMGRYDQAEPLFRRSLQIQEAALPADHPDVAAGLHNLALLSQTLGQSARAESLYQRCLGILKATRGEDHPDVATVSNSLADLYRQQGRYGEAEPLYQRGLQIREAALPADHPDVAQSMNNLALLSQSLGRKDKAEELYRRSLELCRQKLGEDHPEVALRLQNLAVLYWDVGQDDKAEPLLRRCLQIRRDRLGKDHPDVAASLHDLGMVSATTGRWQQAAECLDGARRVLRRHVGAVLPALAETEQRTFLHEKVAKFWHQALSLGLVRPEDGLLATLSADWLLNGKGLAQQALAERTLLARDSSDPKVADLARDLRTVRARLAALTHRGTPPGQEDNVRKERALLTAKEERLSKQLGQAAGRTVRADPWVETAEVRKALPADAVLIDVVRLLAWDFPKRRPQAARYVAWVIPAGETGKVRLVDLGPAEKIEAAVRAVRKALQEAPKRIETDGEPDSEKELRRPLEALSKLVLHPLLAHAGEAKRWVVSPDADLWLVPWSALLLPDGRYAVEQYEIRHAVSGRDLAQQPARPATGRAVLLADPDYDLRPALAGAETRKLLPGGAAGGELRGLPPSGTLPRAGRLQGTAAEARAVAPRLARWLGSEPKVYLREQALEGVFKALVRPRVVMLSTHGFFLADDRSGLSERAPGKLPENPLLRCGLLLAGCNQRGEAADGEDDGILTGLEIVGTDLRGTELVVLSACETGLGDVHNGEGVAGLRQAFQLAGAQSVLASLWNVEDRETARLMVGFFDGLAEGQGKAEALRAAQLALLQSRRQRHGAAHPFFWAAFTLTGQGP